MEYIFILSLFALLISMGFFVFAIAVLLNAHRKNKETKSLNRETLNQSEFNKATKEQIQTIDKRLLSYSEYIYEHVNDRENHTNLHKYFNKISPEANYLFEKTKGRYYFDCSDV